MVESEDSGERKGHGGKVNVLELQHLQQTARAIAETCDGDTLALLALLRTLEEVHVQIRDELFQPSLPDNRQKLYALLRDIEQDGGWPYIPRMKLKQLMANFEEEVDDLLNSPDIK
ncbi:MAG: hypothetical protein AAGD25_15785 [Cyanobacteria bacterium P01_F01_bin.150]